MIHFKSRFSNEKIDLRGFINEEEIVKSEIMVEDCYISEMKGSMICLNEDLKFLDSSIFNECIFLGCTFIGNFKIENCHFSKILKFESCLFFGELEISTSYFQKDLAFYDNTFKSKVSLIKNSNVGSNSLLSNVNQPFENDFEVSPFIKN